MTSGNAEGCDRLGRSTSTHIAQMLRRYVRPHQPSEHRRVPNTHSPPLTLLPLTQEESAASLEDQTAQLDGWRQDAEGVWHEVEEIAGGAGGAGGGGWYQDTDGVWREEEKMEVEETGGGGMIESGDDGIDGSSADLTTADLAAADEPPAVSSDTAAASSSATTPPPSPGEEAKEVKDPNGDCGKQRRWYRGGQPPLWLSPSHAS